MKTTLPIRIIILITIIAIGTNIFAQIPLNIGQHPTLSSNGPSIYLPFNGNTINQGSNSNTAINYGASFTNGICGQCLDFDGIDDRVKITPFMLMIGNYTISSWVYIDSMTVGQVIFTTRDQCQTTYRGYSQAEFAINHYNTPSGGGTNRLRYMLNRYQSCSGGSGGDRYYPPNFYALSNRWYLVSVTIQNNNSENRIVKFYIDCKLVQSIQYLNSTTTDLFGSGFNYKTLIGSGSEGTTHIFPFNGKIDEFRLYNRVLSWGELQDIYYQCKPPNISITKYLGNCTGDSAYIEIINSEDSVLYQFFDSTNQQLLGGPQLGGCNSLFFSTGLITSPTNFYIKATHTGSNNTIVLDTVISLNPTYGGSILYDTVGVCMNDSLMIRGKFYSPPTNAVDTFINTLGCDSILNTYVYPLASPTVNLGNDTSFCDGDSILLFVPNIYDTILWNNNSNLNSIYVNSQGWYWVEVSDSICKAKDSIQVLNLSQNYISINDTSFCNNETWTISLPPIYSYLWSTGSSMPSITIQDSGQYWVEITDICKNYKEYFTIKTIDCSCMMAVPNVFTPNGDGLNDYFYPVISCVFEEYHIAIFNRWGQILFESNNQNTKWDGKYLNQDIPEGVYFYVIDYKQPYSNNKKAQHSGSITIYR